MTIFGNTRLLYLLLILASCLASPPHTTAQQKSSSPFDGNISDAVYTNNYLAFKYTIPKGLNPEKAEANEHLNDPSHAASKIHILLLAATLVKPYKNVVVQAQDANDLENGAAYLQKVAASAARNGLSVLDSPQEKRFGGQKFFRQDYYSPQGQFFQTQVCTLYKGYALDFIISGTSKEDVELLVESLDSLRFNVSDKTR